jgi:uncharacterized membrane protein
MATFWENISKNYVKILIAIHLAIALPLAYFLNVWSDEASTLTTTNFGIQHAFNEIFSVEKQAPLYFLLLSLWRNINDSVFFARIFSIIFTVGSIWIFPGVAKNWFAEKETKYLTVFFALHPFLFCMTLEIRAYSAMILISLLLLKYFYEGFFHDENHELKRKSQIIYVVFAVVSLYTHYYFGFSLVAFFCVLLVLKRWQAAKNYFYGMLAVGLFFIPLFAVISQQFSNRDSAFATERSIVVFLRHIWTDYLTFSFPTEVYAPLEPTFISFLRNWIARIAVAITVAFAAATRFRYLDHRLRVFIVFNAVCCLFMALTYYALGDIYVAIRHFAPMFVASIFLQFLFLSLIINQTSRKIWIVIALILVFLFPYSMFQLYPKLAKRGDWARVAEFVQQNEKPNQPLVVFQVYDVLSFRIHYKGGNKILPDEKFVDFWLEGKKDTEDSFRRQIDFTVSKIPTDADEIWLLTEDNCQTTDACKPLEEFVEKNYNVIETKDFYLERVRLLKKK